MSPGLFSVLLAAGLTATAASFVTPARGLGDGTWLVGGVIRMERPGEPYIHANTGHRAAGLTSVEVDPGTGTLVIRYPTVAPNGARLAIVSMSIDEDESFTAAGVTAGGSGGNGRTSLYFHIEGVPGRVRADDPRISRPGRNLWVTFVLAEID